ncbi:MAG: GNAT family N-acetyltransferase [Antricoccus sp.]
MPAIGIRPRETTDLAVLEEILGAQQPASRYPLRWPLRFPAGEFIVRPGERAALVAVVGEQVVGHVSVTEVQPDEMGAAWAAGVGRSITGISCLSVLFVDSTVRGRGVGRALMEAAESWIFNSGHAAVLDVVQQNCDALRMYRSRGWREIGFARPAWLPQSEPPVILMVKDLA